MVTVIEAIKSRRSIREYRPDPVPDDIISELLECARLAPSAHNSQPWRFIILKNVTIKKKLRQHAYGLRFVESAPCIIVCCVDLTAYAPGTTIQRLKELRISGVLDDVGDTSYVPLPLRDDTSDNELYVYLDQCKFNSAIATEHIVLGALAFGLGTCWIHMFEPEKVHQLLNLPDTVAVVSLLALGYPAQDPPPRPRIPLKRIVLTPIPEAWSLETAREGSWKHF